MKFSMPVSQFIYQAIGAPPRLEAHECVRFSLRQSNDPSTLIGFDRNKLAFDVTTKAQAALQRVQGLHAISAQTLQPSA